MPKSGLFVYRIQPVRPDMLADGPTPEEEATISEHFRYLKDLTQAGVVHLAGRTVTAEHSSFGIVIFSADSEESARAIVAKDPAVQNRVMRAELFPFRIALLGKFKPPDDVD